MHIIREGTGIELYKILLHHLKGVGCPTWLGQKSTSLADDATAISVYLFGFDAGPDCMLASRLITSSVEDAPHVVVHTVFCFFHQLHLCVRSVLAFTDKWQWEGLPREPKYVGGVATVIN